jgi:hypothetical protein
VQIEYLIQRAKKTKMTSEFSKDCSAFVASVASMSLQHGGEEVSNIAVAPSMTGLDILVAD